MKKITAHWVAVAFSAVLLGGVGKQPVPAHRRYQPAAHLPENPFMRVRGRSLFD
ncbi:hypothetical protein ACG2F4_01295 [Halalkalibaculum sp. DA3122]|uniref:hypothetical protein n=1 Tax=Halalkalibaculum sp. DA3122 TaxID=3373607 RepID=UPI0037543664